MRANALLGTAALLLLAGCSGGTPADPGPAEPAPPSSEQQPCYVGIWNMDVPDYEAQSAAYFAELGIPIQDFAMTGTGFMDIRDDGFIDGTIALRSTGRIVVPDHDVPLDVPSEYTFSGNWETGADAATIEFSNWANVLTTTPSTASGVPESLPLDYTDGGSAQVVCSGDSLRFDAPGAPLNPVWRRGS